MKLLQKTIWSYFLVTFAVIALAIPVFYFTLRSLMITTIDEDLVAVKAKIMPKLLTVINNQPAGNMDLPGYHILYEKDPYVKEGDSAYTIGVSATRLLASHVSVNKESYNLQIKTSLVNKLALVKHIVWVLAALLLLLSAGLLWVNHALNKKIWKPFYHTLGKLQGYRVEQHETLQLPHAPVKEFADLNTAVLKLTESNYQAWLSQKEFAENASHEMQSPLAVFQSKLELLMQTQPLTEEQAALITDMANAGKRMSRLNKGLVLLTKIDNNQYLETETVSVKDTLEKLLAQYAFQITQKDIRLSFITEKDSILQANKTLVEILFSNIISNAIRHNIQGGQLIIRLHSNHVVIQNTGKTSALNELRLFQRFYKESTDENSLGLGLEIVKKICTYKCYGIQYGYVNNLHTFTFTF